MPDQVIIQDVALRDGLQNQPHIVTTADKLALAWSLFDAGLQHLEVTSFVSPKAVPQMADAQQLTESMLAYLRVERPHIESGQLSALVPNLHGYKAAVRAGYSQLGVVIATTDSFNRKNLNRTTEEVLHGLTELYARAQVDSVIVHTHLSGAMGCPYEGFIKPDVVLHLAESLLRAGAKHFMIADTIGAGNPKLARIIIKNLFSLVDSHHIGLHLHDTRGMGIAIAQAGLDLGIRRFDSSVGALGGCPFAPGATGNIATEDLVYLCEQQGLHTGISLDGLYESVVFAERITKQSLGGKVMNWLRSQKRGCTSS